VVGETIRKAREGFGISIRELARQAGVSAAQISRVEAGAVEQPSIDTLVAIARPLDRNPKPLLIVSGHLGGQEAVVWLRKVFREHRGAAYDPAVDSELVDDWEHGWSERLAEARRVLASAEPDERELRSIAADVFLTAETEETLWWESWLAPLLEQQGGDELRSLVQYWQLLPAARRVKVLEYMGEPVELSRPERLGMRNSVRSDGGLAWPARSGYLRTESCNTCVWRLRRGGVDRGAVASVAHTPICAGRN
jgi:transcriptional regulator with XRE-family HTH domain